MDTVGRHTAELNKMHKESLDIESIFPANILNSNRRGLPELRDDQKRLEDEIAFQTAYRTSLDFFYKSLEPDNPLDFLARPMILSGFLRVKRDIPTIFSKKAKPSLKMISTLFSPSITRSGR